MIVESELKVWIFVSLSVICGLFCHLCLHIGSMSEEARLSKSCWEFGSFLTGGSAASSSTAATRWATGQDEAFKSRMPVRSTCVCFVFRPPS